MLFQFNLLFCFHGNYGLEEWIKKIHFKINKNGKHVLFLCTSLQMPHLTFIAICMHSFENVCIIKEVYIDR